MRVAIAIALAVAAFTGAVGAEPSLTLVGESSDRYLTDLVSISPAPAAGLRELKRAAGGSISLGAGESAHFSGTGVLTIARGRDETEVSVLDSAGRELWRTAVAPDAGVVSFGSAVASIPRNPHEPGVPYRIDIASPRGTARVERSSRTIATIRSLDRHLVVSSVASDGSPGTTTEVIDGSGTVAWVFEFERTVQPRVVVSGENAVALYPGRASVVRLARDGRPLTEIVLGERRLTDVAFVGEDSDVILWGDREILRLRVADSAILWRSRLESTDDLLSSDASTIAVIDGIVGMPARHRNAGSDRRVDLVLVNLADGTVAGRQSLHETPARPTHVRRFERGDRERLVFPHRVYELSPAEASRP
ncbi:MAG: hypothetical protein R3344_03605 [Acidobacteriota bacterium]|nr:hypothetical protein [Acidobacteriota bacterium]